jgi:hypothetical protein
MPSRNAGPALINTIQQRSYSHSDSTNEHTYLEPASGRTKRVFMQNSCQQQNAKIRKKMLNSYLVTIQRRYCNLSKNLEEFLKIAFKGPQLVRCHVFGRLKDSFARDRRFEVLPKISTDG